MKHPSPITKDTFTKEQFFGWGTTKEIEASHSLTSQPTCCKRSSQIEYQNHFDNRCVLYQSE
jgi:hypothetical protein